VCQEGLNKLYGTHQTAFGLMEGYTGKLNRFNDSEICGKLPLNETVVTPVPSTCLSADCLELNTDRMSNKLLYT
jgi:hypothetical protein